MNNINKLAIGTKVNYAGHIATVVDFCQPACGHAAVVIEYTTSVLGYPGRAFVERKSIIEKGLQVTTL